jgi:hypothetical protein
MDDITGPLADALRERVAAELSKLTGLPTEKALKAVRAEIEGPHPPVEEKEKEERSLSSSWHSKSLPWRPEAGTSNPFSDDNADGKDDDDVDIDDVMERYGDLPYLSVDFFIAYPLEEYDETYLPLESALRNSLQADPVIEIGGNSYYLDKYDFLPDIPKEVLKAKHDIESALSVLFNERAASPIWIHPTNTKDGLPLFEISIGEELPENLRIAAAAVISNRLNRLPNRPCIQVSSPFPELKSRLEP